MAGAQCECFSVLARFLNARSLVLLECALDERAHGGVAFPKLPDEALGAYVVNSSVYDSCARYNG